MVTFNKQRVNLCLMSWGVVLALLLFLTATMPKPTMAQVSTDAEETEQSNQIAFDTEDANEEESNEIEDADDSVMDNIPTEEGQGVQSTIDPTATEEDETSEEPSEESEETQDIEDENESTEEDEEEEESDSEEESSPETEEEDISPESVRTTKKRRIRIPLKKRVIVPPKKHRKVPFPRKHKKFVRVRFPPKIRHRKFVRRFHNKVTIPRKVVVKPIVPRRKFIRHPTKIVRHPQNTGRIVRICNCPCRHTIETLHQRFCNSRVTIVGRVIARSIHSVRKGVVVLTVRVLNTFKGNLRIFEKIRIFTPVGVCGFSNLRPSRQRWLFVLGSSICSCNPRRLWLTRCDLLVNWERLSLLHKRLLAKGNCQGLGCGVPGPLGRCDCRGRKLVVEPKLGLGEGFFSPRFVKGKFDNFIVGRKVTPIVRHKKAITVHAVEDEGDENVDEAGDVADDAGDTGEENEVEGNEESAD